MAPPKLPKVVTISASSLAAFAQCPMKFCLTYREGIRPAVDATPLRVGTNLHHLFEDVSTEADLVAILNRKYAEAPAWSNPADWETERNTLMALFLGYRNYWTKPEDAVEVTEREREFKMLLPNRVVIQGKIDGIGVWKGQKVVIERKTTSSDLTDSFYWSRLKKDLQVSMYTMVLAAEGERVPTLYDVIRKPTIRRGKSETPDAFLTRLAADIVERPTHYYARREIVRTDQDMQQFHMQLTAMAEAIRAYDERGCYWPNWSACKDPYPCPYISLCHTPGALDNVRASAIVPIGFKRIGR